jgi:hypothetical protein
MRASIVTPAKAGAQTLPSFSGIRPGWTPAFAGVTEKDA